MSARRRLAVAAAAVCLGAVLSGCSFRKTQISPRLETDVAELEQDLDLLPPFPEPEPRSGSLWTEGGTGAALVRDHRAFRTNDLVTIVLEESSAGTNLSTTDLQRSQSLGLSAPLVLGNDTWNEFLETDVSTSADYNGEGQTARSSQVSGTITARVMRVLPNGDMVIAGQKTVMVNREKQILTLVGSVRPADVRPSNRVPSSAVGDLTLRMWGKGEVNDTVRQGWFMRMLQKVWPF